jgi:hypothetical protein
VKQADEAIDKANKEREASPVQSPTPTVEPVEPSIRPAPLMVEVEAAAWESRDIEDPEDLLAVVSHEINKLLAYPSMDEAIRARSLAPLLNVAVTIMDKTKIGKELDELRTIATAREQDDASHRANKI